MPNSYAAAVKPGDQVWLNFVNTVLHEAMAGVDFLSLPGLVREVVRPEDRAAAGRLPGRILLSEVRAPDRMAWRSGARDPRGDRLQLQLRPGLARLRSAARRPAARPAARARGAADRHRDRAALRLRPAVAPCLAARRRLALRRDHPQHADPAADLLRLLRPAGARHLRARQVRQLHLRARDLCRRLSRRGVPRRAVVDPDTSTSRRPRRSGSGPGSASATSSGR